MNKVEAEQVLREVMDEYKGMSYPELLDLIRSPLAFERLGPGRCEYQIEIQVFWDDPRKEGGDLRVLGSIDDGRFPYAFVPMTADFIMKPDGSLSDD